MSTSNLSVRTTALLALSQDICALISITIESILSIINFFYRYLLTYIGLERTVKFDKNRYSKCETGRGCAIVVLGANEAAGQSLTLSLAKVGYTVFPLIPLPSPNTNSPPTSSALTHLLLTWSGVQKRLRAKYPDHSGGVVPVILDPESPSADLSVSRGSNPKKPHIDGHANDKDEVGEEGRFSHAGETVRAYCKENKLTLVSIICTSRKLKLKSTSATKSGINDDIPINSIERSRSSEGGGGGTIDIPNGPLAPILMQRSSSAPSISGSEITLVDHPPSSSNIGSPKQSENSTIPVTISTSVVRGTGTTNTNSTPKTTISVSSTFQKPTPTPTLVAAPAKLHSGSLTLTDESDLSSLYRSNILDSIAIIRELNDLLAIPNTLGWSKGRIVFINGEKNGQIIELNDRNHEYHYDPNYNYSHHLNESRFEPKKEKEKIVLEDKKIFDFINEARKKMISLLRDEMRSVGIDVCEVVVGPMSPRIGTTGYHLRQSSEDSNQGTSSILQRAGRLSQKYPPGMILRRPREVCVGWSFHFLNKLWAVDDALLFSSVRRSIEDPYNRPNHRSGISPILNDILSFRLIPFKLGIEVKELIIEYMDFNINAYWILYNWYLDFMGQDWIRERNEKKILDSAAVGTPAK